MCFRNNQQCIGAVRTALRIRVKQVLEDAVFFDTAAPGIDGHRGSLTAKRVIGLRAASIRGFHSFRVTWATLALVADVPVELVRKVTGHQSVSVLLNHYFKPGREDLRRILEEKMPKMFAVGRGSEGGPVADIVTSFSERLKTMTVENWTTIRDKLLKEIAHQQKKECGEFIHSK